MIYFCYDCFLCFRHIGYHEESFIYREDGVKNGLGICSHDTYECSSLLLTSSRAVLWPNLYLRRAGERVFQVLCVLKVVAYFTCLDDEQTWNYLHHMVTSYDLLWALVEEYEGSDQWFFRHDCIRQQKTYKGKTPPAIIKLFYLNCLCLFCLKNLLLSLLEIVHSSSVVS